MSPDVSAWDIGGHCCPRMYVWAAAAVADDVCTSAAAERVSLRARYSRQWRHTTRPPTSIKDESTVRTLSLANTSRYWKDLLVFGRIEFTIAISSLLPLLLAVARLASPTVLTELATSNFQFPTCKFHCQLLTRTSTFYFQLALSTYTSTSILNLHF